MDGVKIHQRVFGMECNTLQYASAVDRYELTKLKSNLLSRLKSARKKKSAAIISMLGFFHWRFRALSPSTVRPRRFRAPTGPILSPTVPGMAVGVTSPPPNNTSLCSGTLNSSATAVRGPNWHGPICILYCRLQSLVWGWGPVYPKHLT
jgi:hypothetical protein